MNNGIAVWAIAIICLELGFVVGHAFSSSYWKGEALRKGVGAYNQNNGEFYIINLR